MCIRDSDKIDNCVAIIQNASSTKYGKKDIVKIDELIDLDYDLLGYVDSNITVNIVKDGKLDKKLHMEPVSYTHLELSDMEEMAPFVAGYSDDGVGLNSPELLSLIHI